MKKALLLAAFVVACAPSEKAATDTPAMAAPAALTAADLAGTWTGTSWIEGTDSVAGRWTVTSADGVGGKIVFEGQADSVAYTTTFDADSAVFTSSVYADPTLPNKPQVTFRAVGRLVGGKAVGTTALLLASKPDSVVGRVRWESTKAP